MSPDYELDPSQGHPRRGVDSGGICALSEDSIPVGDDRVNFFILLMRQNSSKKFRIDEKGKKRFFRCSWYSQIPAVCDYTSVPTRGSGILYEV